MTTPHRDEVKVLEQSRHDVIVICSGMTGTDVALDAGSGDQRVAIIRRDPSVQMR